MRRGNDVKRVLTAKVSHAFTLIRERFTTSPRSVAAFGLVAVAGTSALLHTSAATAEPSTLNTTAAQVVMAPQHPDGSKSTPTKTPTSKKTSTKAPTTKTTTAKAKPTAGYNQTQMDNAAIIVKAGKELGISERGQIIAVATAMQESNLYNLASYVVPESLKYAHQGTGADYDSVGLFQQRYTTGWGTVKEIMNPSESAKKFYRALLQVPGWQNLPITVAAQTVQGSAFPDAYAKHQANATAVVKAVNSVK
jgi:hypothetical protein